MVEPGGTEVVAPNAAPAAEVERGRPAASITEHRTFTYAFLGACVLVGLAFRAYAASESGLWRDEALFLFVVRMPSVASMVHFLHFHESHPPLFYFLMRAWLEVFGQSAAAALAVPVLIGAALPVLAFQVGRRTFGHSTGLVAALLTATSPDLVAYSGQIRPYSLMPVLGLLSVHYLWAALGSRTWRPWLYYGLWTLALLYTHYWGWLVFVAECIAVPVLFAWRYLRPERGTAMRWLGTLCGIGIAYLPWLPILLYQARHAGHTPAWVRNLHYQIHTFVATEFLAPGPDRFAPWGPDIHAIRVLEVLVVVGLACFIRHAGRQGNEARLRWQAAYLHAAVPLVAFALALSLMDRSDMMLPYCYLTVAPSLLLVLSAFICCLPRLRAVPVAAVVAGSVSAYYAIAVIAPHRFVKSNARELSRAVATRIQPTDLVVIAPEWMCSAFNYYFTPQNAQIDFPVVGREGATSFADVLSRMADVAAYDRTMAILRGQRAAGNRVWLIIDEHTLVQQVSMARSLARFAARYAPLIRTNELRVQLDRLYGKPETVDASACRCPGIENLRGYLYAVKP